MDNSTQDHELLVQYLDDELDPRDRELVDSRLATEIQLREQLDDLVLAREAVRHYGLRSQVASIHNEMMTASKVPVRKMGGSRRMLRYSISVAAGILLLVGAFLLYNFFSLSADKVFARNYQSYEISTVRGVSDDDSVIQAYRQKRYSEVIHMHDRREDGSLVSAFFAGMSHLRLNNFTGAIADLEEVVTGNKGSGTPIFKDEAEYYLALAYIKNRDFDLAIPILEEIKDNESHIYHERVSRKLIRDVKMLKWR